MVPLFHVAELIVNITAELPPDMSDWPSYVQDRIYLAVHELSTRTGRNYKLFHAVCDYDVDQGWNIKAIARAPRDLIH